LRKYCTTRLIPGKFQSDDLAPRIKALMQKREELQCKKSAIEDRLRCKIADIIEPREVRHYVSDLRALLANSIIPEQRSFFKSFVEKSEVYDDKVKMYYTIPVSPDSISDEMEGVLPLLHHG